MNIHIKSLLSRDRIKRAIEAFVNAEVSQPDPVEGKPVDSKELFDYLANCSRASERERLTPK